MPDAMMLEQDAFGKRLGDEGRACMNGITPPMKDLKPFPTCENRRSVSLQKGPSPDHVSSPISDFQPQQL